MEVWYPCCIDHPLVERLPANINDVFHFSICRIWQAKGKKQKADGGKKAKSKRQ